MVVDFETLIDHAEKTDFEGWDFGVLADRLTEDDPSWDYPALVRTALPSSTSLLDMGTGGGELLSTLRPLPDTVVATEAHPPNVPVARRRLEPLGVRVVAIDEDESVPLPFDDAAFDLVINRHESFLPQEIHRILRPGGVFITQQVGGKDLMELNTELAAPPLDYTDWSAEQARRQLENVGLEITDQREEFPAGHFTDIGAVILYLRMVPWQIPDYRPADYRDRMRGLHDRITTNGPLVVHHHRFLLVARRPR